MTSDTAGIDRLRTILARKRELKDCPTCGAPYSPTKKWQRFCSTKCRNNYHNDKAEQQKEVQLLEIRTLKQDYEELCVENSHLRKRVQDLEQELEDLRKT